MSEASILADDLLQGNKFYYRASDYQLSLINSFNQGKVPGRNMPHTVLKRNIHYTPRVSVCLHGLAGIWKVGVYFADSCSAGLLCWPKERDIFT